LLPVCFAVSAPGDQWISVLIHGSPHVNMLTMNLGEYLIKIPGITQTASPFFQLVGVFRPKPSAPVPN